MTGGERKQRNSSRLFRSRYNLFSVPPPAHDARPAPLAHTVPRKRAPHPVVVHSFAHRPQAVEKLCTMYPRNLCYSRLDGMPELQVFSSQAYQHHIAHSPSAALDKLGSAAFFAPLVSQMLPPYMALSIYIFALLTLVVGLCFGWAWGVAAMAAALRARSQSLYQSQLQTESSG